MEEPEHFQELCRYVGFVVLQAQLLESSLVRYYALSMRLEKNVAADEIQIILSTADRKTLGDILQKISKSAPLSEIITELLLHIKSERNWVVHQINRDNSEAIFDPTAAVLVFERLDSLAKSTIEAMGKLDVVGREMMSRLGFDSELLDKQVELRFQRRGKTGDVDT